MVQQRVRVTEGCHTGRDGELVVLFVIGRVRCRRRSQRTKKVGLRAENGREKAGMWARGVVTSDVRSSARPSAITPDHHHPDMSYNEAQFNKAVEIIKGLPPSGSIVLTNEQRLVVRIGHDPMAASD